MRASSKKVEMWSAAFLIFAKRRPCLLIIWRQCSEPCPFPPYHRTAPRRSHPATTCWHAKSLNSLILRTTRIVLLISVSDHLAQDEDDEALAKLPSKNKHPLKKSSKMEFVNLSLCLRRSMWQVDENASISKVEASNGGQNEFRTLRETNVGRRRSVSWVVNGDVVIGRIGSS